MPIYPSVAVAIDKNKISSTESYLALLEIDTIDPNTGNVTDTIRLVHNTENFIHNGFTYLPVPFEFDVRRSKGELPQLTLSVTDVHQSVTALLMENFGGTDFPVRLKVVSTVSPDTVEMQENFTINETKVSSGEYNIDFTLGAENPLAFRFPFRMMFRNRCFWKYRDSFCRYTGAMPSCDFTFRGPNGCQAHGNTVNFGGFPGIRRGGG